MPKTTQMSHINIFDNNVYINLTLVKVLTEFPENLQKKMNVRFHPVSL